METPNENPTIPDPTTNIQHVNKKSSDELLRKFAELEEEAEARAKELRMSKRRKRSLKNRGQGSESPSNNCGSGLVERKRLLSPTTAPRKSAVMRQLGIGRAQLIRAREIRNKSLLGILGKTWRRTVEGASRVFMEKQYNRHRRLISDVV